MGDSQFEFAKFSKKFLFEYENNKDDIPGILTLMEQISGEIELFIKLTT